MISPSSLPSNLNSGSEQHLAKEGIHQARSFGQPNNAERFKFNAPESLSTSVTFNILPVDLDQEEDQEAVLGDQETQGFNHFATLSPLAETNTEKDKIAAFSALPVLSSHRHRVDSMPMSAAQTENIGDLTASKPSLVHNDSLLTKVAMNKGHAESVSTQPVSQIIQGLLQASPLAETQPQSQAQSHTTMPVGSVSSANTQGPEWASVKIDTGAGKWGEQMMQVLHDRVSLQAQQNMQEAKIRLDPPELGKLDVLVRVEGDRLNVQINASTTATREALMQVSDRLRAELQNQHFVHIDVNIGSGDSRPHSSPQHSEQNEQVFSAREIPAIEKSGSQSEHWLSTHA